MMRSTIAYLSLLAGSIIFASIAVASSDIPTMVVQFPEFQCCGTTGLIVGSAGIVLLLYLKKRKREKDEYGRKT